MASVVDDNHFESIGRIRESVNGLQARGKLLGLVIDRNADGKERDF